MSTLGDLYRAGTERLAAASVPDAAYDARILLQEAFGLEAARFVMLRNETLEAACQDKPARDKALQAYQLWISQRARRIPLQQILGTACFYGLSFLLTEDVLCPRQDTEILVEQVLRDLEARQAGASASPLRCLDLCTGSGCIAIALAARWPNPPGQAALGSILAADISGRALALAEKNARRLLPPDVLGKVDFRCADLFNGIGEYEGCFDLILSNPPYIPSAVIGTLEPEVRLHEPRLALDGGADGRDFFRRIVPGASLYLREGGRLYLEIGHDQAEWLAALLSKAGFHEITVFQDLGGQDRVVRATR